MYNKKSAAATSKYTNSLFSETGPKSSKSKKEDDPKKGKKTPSASTLDFGPPKGGLFDTPTKAEPKLRANPNLTDAEAKAQRAALAKDLRTGKINVDTYNQGMQSSRTANDVQNVKDNAGGSGVKNKKGGKCTPAETRSRDCGKDGKGF